MELSPAEFSDPDSNVVLEELEKKSVEVKLFKGDSYKQLSDAFGLYIDGLVFNEDQTKFKDVLQTEWRAKTSDKVEVGM